MKRIAVVCVLAACSKGSATGSVDAHEQPDARDDDAQTGYRHTIQIDGTDDFLSAEQFSTTSAGYGARVTWDEQNIYVGYSGADLDPATADTVTKWLFIYIDANPGTPNGAFVDETYNTQGATFPSGFKADLYVRWRCDALLLTLKTFAGAGAMPLWADGAAPLASHGGNFVEIAIPRATIGTSNRVDLVAWMINEKNGAESSYAGMYPGNFTDGYAPNLALTKHLKIDFTSERDPNAPANQGP